MFAWTRQIKIWICEYLPIKRIQMFPNIIRKIIYVFALSYAIPPAIIRILRNPLALTEVSIPITTKCTLKCKECANLIQYYGNATKPSYNISKEDLIKHFNALIDTVYYIRNIIILGGEPFVHPEIGYLVQYICANENVNRVTIITNGTILPSNDLLTIIANKKIVVRISDYGKNSRKKDELISLLKAHNIMLEVPSMKYWTCYGDTRPRGRSQRKLIRVFRKCKYPMCHVYLNGEFHHCARSAHGMDLGLLPHIGEDYVNLVDLEKSEAQKQMKRLLYKTKYIMACDYCDSSKEIPLIKVVPGEQIISNEQSPEITPPPRI